jgi:hypothetical protein
MAAVTEKRFRQPVPLDSDRKESLVRLLRERVSSLPIILFTYIHGSFVKSNAARDIDVAVFGKGKGGLFFESDLSAELSKACSLEVEVRVIIDAHVSFQMAVLRNRILLFSRDEVKRTDFIEDVGRRYREYVHFRNLFLGVDGVRHRLDQEERG